MTGLVYKSTGSWYIVRDDKAQFWNARMKGVLKLDEITSTNPVAVGDLVSFEIESEAAATALISDILPRHNYINRQSPRHKHQHHIVAANLDQTLLVATLKEPKTSQGFIDRFLVAAAMYHVTPLIVFNKVDLYRQKEMDRYEALRAMYESIGYRVLLVSAVSGQGMDALQDTLTNKTTLLSGHSGVGKSSLLNTWFPGMNRKTQDVSGWSGKGQHTTTFAEMFDLPQGGKIIDTPGMREFGLVDISKQELSHYFLEMKPLLPGCQFNNCQHYNEPGCAVKKAVQEGHIHEDRYISYLSILDSIEEKQY
jgi:ribosome biogenesis GTPase